MLRDCLRQAFPSISTGVYGYPIQQASVAAMEQVKAFLAGAQGNQVRPRRSRRIGR